MVAGDRVTVLVRILGPARFNITLDGQDTDEKIIRGALQADVFRSVSPAAISLECSQWQYRTRRTSGA